MEPVVSIYYIGVIQRERERESVSCEKIEMNDVYRSLSGLGVAVQRECFR